MPESARTFSQLWSVDRDAKRVAAVMVVALFIGACLVAAGTQGWKATWIGLLWASACSAGGWFLGFLFGIPRSLSSDTARTSVPGADLPVRPNEPAAPTQPHDPSTPPTVPDGVEPARTDTGSVTVVNVESQADHAEAKQTTVTFPSRVDSTSSRSGPPPSGASTAVNTNLEQISDWLTKIIVGVTLVESKEVIGQLQAAGHVIGQALGGEQSDSFAMALLIYFFTSGLLGSYLLTRLFLQRAFSDATMAGR
ncbi:hypothetical protein ACFQ3P_25820 [Paraburkholderia sabiae]|uniref:Uncharacterized protein n=1 Tax=Paraburkholderia sabiae TaxID=273251 RepID=A0ABU9QMC1_9BURK|nr:hypothetical protein [Paraburkholderia sabiae]WJZ77331.1 hypothetical protein QEN71_35255 [Paraburkholderia sabiae]CAD6547827.1 hypothetical protein LMG24235_04489 [Paraburkholderia sabiae]